MELQVKGDKTYDGSIINVRATVGTSEPGLLVQIELDPEVGRSNGLLHTFTLTGKGLVDFAALGLKVGDKVVARIETTSTYSVVK